LDSQFPQTVQDVLRLLQITFRCLNKGHTVLNVAFRLMQTPDLAAHLFGYCKPGSIIPRTVNPQTGA